MSGSAVTATVLVSADGTDWRDVSAPLAAVTVEDDDRITDQAVIRFDDSTGVLADASFEGLEVRVGFGASATPTYIFEGVVMAARMLAAPRRQLVELTALDFTYRLAARPYDPAEWRAGETLSSVLTRVVGRPANDLRPFQIEPSADIMLDTRRPSRPANVNEWEFVLDQARRQGCLAFCEFDGVDTSNFYFTPLTKIVAAEPVGELTYARGGGTLLEFCYERSSALAAPVRAAATIDPATGTARTAPAPAVATAAPLPAPDTDRAAELGARRGAALEALTEVAATATARLAGPVERISGESARTAAELAYRPAQDPTAGLGLHGRGIALGTVALRAKSRVRIAGVAPWAVGDWYVRRVGHHYRRGGSGPNYSTEFLATR
ncbi:hypothetical protein [Nocardia goodfellowii]|uniref:Phage late control D family protein n=1 Tax=Nocardia goodfellowii TaxID=882446 RepID=A0ABS4QMN1_9NOCA|nr:hypothetical protein [Nocardia goodfellowii]MBP2192966.1 hypothetical protein [Nocardia goodfellowii]